MLMRPTSAAGILQKILFYIEFFFSSEMPHWCIKSITSDEWTFDALWNRLQLKISFKDNQDHCTATLHFIPKEPTIGKQLRK